MLGDMVYVSLLAFQVGFLVRFSNGQFHSHACHVAQKRNYSCFVRLSEKAFNSMVLSLKRQLLEACHELAITIALPGLVAALIGLSYPLGCLTWPCSTLTGLS